MSNTLATAEDLLDESASAGHARDAEVDAVPESITAQHMAWSSSSSEPEHIALGVALFHLQQWVMELRRQNLAQQDAEGVFVLSPMVASRFALGFRPACAFVVMPELEMRWAQDIVWSHAAMRFDKKDVFLVAQPIDMDGVPATRFGLAFAIDSQQRADKLMAHGTLELRRFERMAVPAPNGDVRWKVSDEPLASMPLVIIEEDEAVFGADLAKKKKKFHGAGR